MTLVNFFFFFSIQFINVLNSLKPGDAYMYQQTRLWLTHRSQVTHICVGNLTIIGSDNDLLPE